MSTNDDELTKIKNQVATLQDLLDRLEPLRQLPARLIRRLPSHSPNSADPLNMLIDGPAPPMTPKLAFGQLNGMLETLRSPEVQGALKAAKESEKVDPTGIVQELRRERTASQAKKRRRISPEPASGLSILATHNTPVTGHFPPHALTAPQISSDNLESYIRGFNKGHSLCKLHIWTRGPKRERYSLNGVTVLRFSVPNVFIAYIACWVRKGMIAPESATFFGPRERRSPHGQSIFAVYQGLSQQLAKMIQSYPTVSLSSLVELLESYKGLFVDACTSCERVLSAEGHVPPTLRIWTTSSFPMDEDSIQGHWEARHVACRLG